MPNVIKKAANKGGIGHNYLPLNRVPWMLS